MHSYGARIYVFTARPIDYYKQTKLWLDKWRVPYVDIYMRPTDDTRSDKAVKSDFIKTFTEDKKEKIHFAIDDRLVICNFCIEEEESITGESKAELVGIYAMTQKDYKNVLDEDMYNRFWEKALYG